MALLCFQCHSVSLTVKSQGIFFSKSSAYEIIEMKQLYIFYILMIYNDVVTLLLWYQDEVPLLMSTLNIFIERGGEKSVWGVNVKSDNSIFLKM